MLIEQYSELKVMRLLARCWFKDFSIYELAKEAGLTPPTAYKSVKKLLARGVMIKKQKRLRINLQNHFSYQFKLLNDAERFASLPLKIQEKTEEILKVFRARYQEIFLSFIIFGSMAAGEYTSSSDLDIMAVVQKKKELDYRREGLLNLGRINLLEKDKAEFEKEYLLGHDLTLASLMNGIILYDAGFLSFFFNKPLPPVSEGILQQKKERLEQMKQRIFILLKGEDRGEMIVQFQHYLLERARLILLQAGIVPSSKKDIIEKIKKTNKPLYYAYTKVNLENAKKLISQNVCTSQK